MGFTDITHNYTFAGFKSHLVQAYMDKHIIYARGQNEVNTATGCEQAVYYIIFDKSLRKNKVHNMIGGITELYQPWKRTVEERIKAVTIDSRRYDRGIIYIFYNHNEWMNRVSGEPEFEIGDLKKATNPNKRKFVYK